MKMCREYSLTHGVSVLRFLAAGENDPQSNLLAGTSNGRAYLLDQHQTVSNLTMDKSTIWNLGQIPHTQDYVGCLGSGAVDVVRVESVATQPELVKLCSLQLSEAPITGNKVRPDAGVLYLLGTSFYFKFKNSFAITTGTNKYRYYIIFV
jgi:hypothetical protein